MQRLQTDKLYIVGLFIISGEEYHDDELILSRRFLKWIVVENESTLYTACFKDIKTGVNYFSSGRDIGDLYIDMNTLFSFNNLTNKFKVSKEEIYRYLEDFKQDYNISKIKTRRIINEMLLELIKEHKEDAAVIIEKVMDKFNEETPENMKRFMRDISESLDLPERKNKTRNRRREWSKNGKSI